MTGRELYRRLVAHHADRGLEETPWKEIGAGEREIWEQLAEGVVDRHELTGAFDRIGGLPDRNTESPESFSERVEAGDAHRVAFDVALVLSDEDN